MSEQMNEKKHNAAPAHGEAKTTDPHEKAPHKAHEKAAHSAEEPQTEKAVVDETKFAALMAAAEAKAEKAHKELEDAKDTLLRTAAEYDNFRKRSAREHDAAFDNGVSSAVEAILPVVDTLKMAANADTADETYKKGVLMTLDQFKKALEKIGVTEMEAEGQPFDPTLHNAVMQQPAPEGVASGTVLQVMQTGYMLHDKVVRHAMVAVAE